MSGIREIGRYRVERLLGAGGFASVWLAYDDRLDAPVAIKVLGDIWAHHLDVRERFLAEARLLRHAESEHLLRVHDVGELPDGRPYFVAEYADRGSLADRLARGELTRDEAMEVLRGVGDALRVLHGMGVVHRDLTPANVLYRSTPEGGTRQLLADLGLAKALAQGSGLTAAAGSPGYMAPEQGRPGSVIDLRADVYGLAALAHRLLTGVTPGTPDARPLPEAIAAVLRRGLRADPARRWPAVEDFLAALTARGWRPRRGHLLLGGAAVLVAAATITVVVAAPEPPAADAEACRADEVWAALGAIGADEQTGRITATLSLTPRGRPCTVRGRLGEVRFLMQDGSELPRALGDGVGEPWDAELYQEGGEFDAELSWDSTLRGTEYVLAPVPARLEFRLPGADRRTWIPWRGGPVGDSGPVEIGPVLPPRG